ncbi:MAG: hypothetical protein Q4G63_02380 [Bacteroidia bacterium]|nr:hypothetical protein [Bacteroidia bacterium]
MKTAIFTIICMFLFLPSFGQEPETKSEKFHKNIYLEGLGSSIIAGINYDMRLQKGHMDGLGFRAGVGLAPLSSGSKIITVPLEVNYLLGKKQSSLVSGIGILPFYGSFRNQKTTDNFGGFQIKGDTGGVALAGVYLVLGYRFQPMNNGLMFQVNWNPMISGSAFNAKWFGVSIGYGFK